MDHSPEKFITVFCTVPDMAAADAVTNKVIEERLVPCVSIVPGLVSVYRWKGEVRRENELLLVMKSRVDLFDMLSLAIKAVHPYEIPEIVAIPFSDGYPPYLEWIDENT